MILVFSCIYIINIVTFAMFGYDKHNAVYSKWRIPEFLLLIFSFIGGALGALSAMILFRHKTKHPKFVICVPIFLFLQLALDITIRILQ